MSGDELDKEALRQNAQLDQLEAYVGEMLLKIEDQDLISLFSDCLAGDIADRDSAELYLIGILAALQIRKIMHSIVKEGEEEE